MDFIRSKNPANVYSLVGSWYNNAKVPYVAHAISQNGQASILRATLELQANNSADHHPDQQYWKEVKQAKPPTAVPGIVTALAANGLARIEIDCKLMPCFVAGRYEKCLFRVPALLRDLYALQATELWIFSHANENMGSERTPGASRTPPKQGSNSKRRIVCKANDTVDQLAAAFNAHSGWHWGP